MGIGSITSTNSMSSMQLAMARSTDSESKSIQNEITGVQQQMQKLSTSEELSVNEKTNERKKLQNEIANLNTELKQHQEELRRSQRREIMMAELQEDKKLAEEEKSEDKIQTEETSLDKKDEKNLPTDNLQSEETKKDDIADNDTKTIDSNDNDIDIDTGLSHKKMHALVSADTSVQQAGRQGTVITRIRDGIVILKGEMNQDEKRGVDTEQKQTELEKMEKAEQRARASQFSVLGEANNIMKSAANITVTGTKNETVVNTENNTTMNAFKLSKEEEALQQKFYVSLD